MSTKLSVLKLLGFITRDGIHSMERGKEATFHKLFPTTFHSKLLFASVLIYISEFDL
jgi:hypothetical protein